MLHENAQRLRVPYDLVKLNGWNDPLGRMDAQGIELLVGAPFAPAVERVLTTPDELEELILLPSKEGEHKRGM